MAPVGQSINRCHVPLYSGCISVAGRCRQGQGQRRRGTGLQLLTGHGDVAGLAEVGADEIPDLAPVGAGVGLGGIWHREGPALRGQPQPLTGYKVRPVPEAEHGVGAGGAVTREGEGPVLRVGFGGTGGLGSISVQGTERASVCVSDPPVARDQGHHPMGL